MGWISYHANYYKNDTVDRKAECDAYFLEGSNKGYYDVVKSSMVGSTYYAAIRKLKSVEESVTDGKVWAAIFLTSVNIKDYYNFSYKNMDETVGPCQYDCPKSILSLLSETDSEWALEWRNNCKQWKAFKSRINKLPVGTKIKFLSQFDFDNGLKAGDEVILEKSERSYRMGKTKYHWMDGKYRWKPSLISKDFQIVG